MPVALLPRAIRGAPDDGPDGYFNSVTSTTSLAKKYLNVLTPAASNQLHAGNAASADLGTLSAMMGGTQDGEPDIFYFNFGKYSGKFFMNESGQFVASPLQALKVQYATSSLINGAISQWILTTPDGVRWVFGQSLDLSRHAWETNDNGAPWPLSATGWYLVEVYSPHNDLISLNYTNIGYSYRSRTSEVLNQIVGQSSNAPGALPAKQNNIVTNNMVVPRLTSITSSTGTITFTAGANRTDLPGDASLATINIFGSTDLTTPLKKWQFYYDYYTNRLTLDSLSEYSASGLPSGNRYTFTYAGPLPDANPDWTAINAQDLWGYYNGAQNSVLPQGLTTNSSQFGQVTVFGADRHSDGNYMTMGTLTRITYPTGGYSSFDYEPNTVYTNPVNSSIPTAGVPKMAGFNFQYNQTIADTFSVAYPDPNTGKALLTGTLHSMVNSCPYDPYGYNQCYQAWLEGINGTQYGPQQFKEGSLTASLLPGTYRIVAQGANLSGQENNEFYFYLYWTEYPPPPPSNPNGLMNVPIGGLRIKRITNFDGVGTQVTKYLYNKFSDTTSSAVLVNQPYIYGNIFEVYQRFCSGSSWVDGSTDYVQVRSYPLIPLMPTQGAAVGYANVTKLDGENGENGKEEYTFTTANDYPDEMYPYRPYAPSCSFDWRRGQLLKATTYKNNGGTFYPVRSSSTHFTNAVKQSIGYGLRVEVDQESTMIGGGCTPFNVGAAEYYAAGYRTASELLYKDADTIREYDQSNPAAYMQTILNYKYDTVLGHYLLLQTTSTNSKGQAIETDQFHPQDLTLSGTAETARQNLISNFMLVPVLDIKNSINGVQTTETKNNYKVFPNGMPLLESIELKDGAGSSEKRVEFLKYDGYAHIAQQHKINGMLNTYLWNYNRSYPIASVLNADSANIAYTSFEGDGTGNWTMPDTLHNRTNAFTGSQSYDLSGTKTITATVNAGPSYIVSYWSRGGSLTVKSNGTSIGTSLTGATKRGWTYYEHLLPTTTTSVSVSASAATIDELRLFPATAQMTTYTYVPSLGMTSTCTPDNKVTYYEYDAFMRLLRTRDIDSNIVKQYDYKYQQQGAYSNSDMTASFSKACGAGYITTPISYTVPAKKYYSTISQHYVDSLALADLNTNGQTYANAHGVCTPVYYNVQQSGSFTKDNCTGCLAGSTVTYIVPAGIYSSTISQHYVDSIALAMVNADGQKFADSTGTCSTPPTANIAGTNTLTILVQMSFKNNCTGTTYNYNMPANSSANYGPIPQGTYQVTVQGSSTPHTYIVNGNSQTGTFATFNNIVVNGPAAVRAIN